jgi:hypothetical protein
MPTKKQFVCQLEMISIKTKNTSKNEFILIIWSLVLNNEGRRLFQNVNLWYAKERFYQLVEIIKIKSTN